MNDYHVMHQGKEYRRIAAPRKGAVNVPGEWEFYYELPNGETWHRVQSLTIRGELDRQVQEALDA